MTTEKIVLKDPTVHYMLREFLNVITPKYPQYEFVIKDAWHVSVAHGTTHIGKVGTLDSKLLFSNVRISRDRARGENGISTGDVKKAVGIFNKYFQVMSADEVMEGSIIGMSRCISRAIDIKNEAEVAMGKVLKHIYPELLGDWERIGPLALASGNVSSAVIDRVPKLFAEAEMTEVLYNAYRKAGGYNVVISGGEYYVYQRYSKTNATKVAFEGLSNGIKRGLGILKMVPDQTFLADVGVRNTSYSFFIIGGEE
jgi:hypothetical protein